MEIRTTEKSWSQEAVCICLVLADTTPFAKQGKYIDQEQGFSKVFDHLLREKTEFLTRAKISPNDLKNKKKDLKKGRERYPHLTH